MSKSQRVKGRRWEQLVAADHRAIFGEGVRRGWQAREGADQCDVEGTPFHIEASHQVLVPLRAKLRQALADVKPGRIPVVVAKDDRSVPLVLLRYSDWLDMVREWHERGQKCAECRGTGE